MDASRRWRRPLPWVLAMIRGARKFLAQLAIFVVAIPYVAGLAVVSYPGGAGSPRRSPPLAKTTRPAF